LSQRQRGWLWSWPWYLASLLAILLVGIQGTQEGISQLFYGEVPLALLLYALMTFVAGCLKREPILNVLAAALACWSMLLAQQLSLAYVLGAGIGMVLLGWLSRSLFRPASASEETALNLAGISWSWLWYSAFLISVLVLGTSPFVSGRTFLPDFVAASMLVFTLLATVVMLVERAPEFLIFPASMAAWTIYLWPPTSGSVALIVAYTLLCALIFAAQFVWRFLPAAMHWLPETSLHNGLSLGGLCFVLLYAFAQGALSADAGMLAHAGVLALVMLSLLIFLYGLLHLSTVARSLPQTLQDAKRTERLDVAHSVQHWCYYASGLQLSLAVSWELLAFHQTRFDLLSLAPASYLIVIAPFLLRDQVLPERRIMGQLLALGGAALLLLPSLWLSFNGADLLSTVILLGESLALLVVGLIARLRIFILSSVALVVAGTLRLLFLSIPPSVPILLMIFGGLLVLLATLLVLFRHRLQTAWTHWE
jgi:hypothetical protein